MDFLKHVKQQQHGGARREKVSSFEIPINLVSPSTQLMHILKKKCLEMVSQYDMLCHSPIKLIGNNDERYVRDCITEKICFWD